MQALRVFHYLLKHDSWWMPIDHTHLDIEYTGPQDASPEVRRKIMRGIYRDAREEIPDNVPEIRGKEVQLNIYVMPTLSEIKLHVVPKLEYLYPLIRL